MRMFAAVLPPLDVVEDLEDFLAPRRDHAEPDRTPLRWTMPETWHVTLGFMPRVDERRLDDLVERLARAGKRRRPFTLGLAGGGAFPDAAAARVVHIGVRADPADAEELRRLAVGVRAAAGKAGTEVDGGRFRPHVTLARLRRPGDAVRWLRVLDTYVSREWTVGDMALVRSHLGEGPRGRPRYEVLERFPLLREG
jgi:2'-5' RNA ligase